MEFITRNKDRILFFTILLLGVFLILFRLTRGDVVSDDAHYTFRSIDYVDFVSSQNQTTPLQWFGEIPGWSRWSFHDAPPLFFAIQNAFFKLFGVSSFVARLPSALAGVLSLVLVYLLGRELYGKDVGVISMSILSTSSYFLWISRIAYLEGLETALILASLYFFAKSKANANYLFAWGASLGLAFLTKYTAFYLVPVFLIWALATRRDVFKRPRVWKLLGALLLILILFSPVIIYNIQMFKTRGHFDMQFAILFGQSMADWPIIERSVASGIIQNVKTTFSSLHGSISLPVSIIFYVSFFYLLYVTVLKKIRMNFFSSSRASEASREISQSSKLDEISPLASPLGRNDGNAMIILNVLFLTVLFALIAPTFRYLPLYAPFIALAIGYMVCRLWHLIHFQGKQTKTLFPEQGRRITFSTPRASTGSPPLSGPFNFARLRSGNNYIFLMILFIAVVSLLFSYQLVYAINTNHLYSPLGKPPLWYSPSRIENQGFHELDRYVSALLENTRPSRAITFSDYHNISSTLPKATKVVRDEGRAEFSSLIVYDENMNWFGRFWALERWMKINYVPVLSLENTLKQAREVRKSYADVGVDSAYVIIPLGENAVPSGEKEYEDYGSQLVAYLVKSNIQPVEIIRNPEKKEAFAVYFVRPLWETLERMFPEEAKQQSIIVIARLPKPASPAGGQSHFARLNEIATPQKLRLAMTELYETLNHHSSL